MSRVTVEPHPYPEQTLWRVGPPVAAAVLAVAGFVVMLGVAPESAQTVALLVVLVAQVVLMAGRGVVLRRSARTADLPVYWHQFFFAWSFFAGTTHLLEGHLLDESGSESLVEAAIHVGSGLVFAALLLGAFWAMNRAPRR